MSARLTHRSHAVRGLAALLISALVVFSLLLVPSARAQRARAAMNDGTVTMVTDGSAADLDPATDELASSANIQENLDETLLTFVGSSITKYRPVLATSWNVSNGG
jgi:peptide/nickel transport system substrate-binding protein